MTDNDTGRQQLDRLARMSPDEILRFKQAFFDENETLISAGNPKLSQPARDYYLSLCDADQQAEAAKVYAFHRQLDDVLTRALAIVQQRALNNFDSATQAFEAFIEDFAPNVRAATACAKMPEDSTVATVLAALVETPPGKPAPGAGSGADDGATGEDGQKDGRKDDEAAGGEQTGGQESAGQESAGQGSAGQETDDRKTGGQEAGGLETGGEQTGGQETGGGDGAGEEEPNQDGLRENETKQGSSGRGVDAQGEAGDRSDGAQGAAGQKKKWKDSPDASVDYGAILRAAVDYLIPRDTGYPVNNGWRYKAPAYFLTPYFIAAGKPKPKSRYAPMGVTWHWTAGSSLAGARDAMAKRQPYACKASAHYCIGKNAGEGVERYVSLENGSWHAGKKQILRWDGRACAKRGRKGTVWIDQNWKGTRSLVGVEIVGLGEPLRRSGVRDPWAGIPEDQIIHAALPNGSMTRALAFNDEQYRMAIAVGREIVERWPHIRPWHHHGHLDICPDYKWDPLGFDYARVLRGVYPEEDVPDVWTPLMSVAQRQRVLNKLLELNRIDETLKVDGLWGGSCRVAFRAFQQAMATKKDKARPSSFGQWTATFFPPEVSTIEATPRPLYTAVNGYWTTFTNWDAHAELTAAGLSLEDVAGGPERDVADPARRVEEG